MKKVERCENFAKRLVEAREEHGVMAKDVAKFIGVTSGTMSRFENGVRTPDAMQIKQLAEILPVNLNWLITGRGCKDSRLTGEEQGVPVYHSQRDHIKKGGDKEQNILIPEVKGATESYQVQDMFMSPRIMENDYVLVDREEPSIGDLVAYRNEYYDVQVGWLRAVGGDGERYFVPENPEYSRVPTSKCDVVGRVICSVKVDRYL